MLTRELMGLLSLGILWINTLLIAAAAGIDVLALARVRRSLRRVHAGALGEGLIEARVVRGDGPDGALARHRVEQIGRSAGSAAAGRGIHFGDRAYEGELYGGAVELEGARDGRAEELEIAPSRAADVWVSAEARRAAAACPSSAIFDEAYEDAKKARGFVRTIVTSVGPGERVWITGVLRRDPKDERLKLAAPSSLAPLVSTLDPRSVCARKIALSVASIAAILAACAALTAVALYPPRFGLVSTIGGALCLLFFLLVQPAGTALRDAVRLPHQAFVRGLWRRERD